MRYCPPRNRMRDRVVLLVASGELMVTEAAWIAAVSPARVSQWCKEAGVDPAASRRKRIEAIARREHERIMLNLATAGRTKRGMRRIADNAMSHWNNDGKARLEPSEKV